MTCIENNKIFVSYGDSMDISITPLNDDETPYFLKDGEYVRFLVRLFPGAIPVIEKTLTVQDESGALMLQLSPRDTRIARTTYMYEAKLCDDEDTVVTFIGGGAEKARFIVT